MNRLNSADGRRDDARYDLVLDASKSPHVAGGVLQRRCDVSPATPGGFEVVGTFTMAADGTWEAHIAQAPSAGDGCTVVVRGVERAVAIVALWRARHDAHSVWSAAAAR
jgi:hypothetical protein